MSAADTPLSACDTDQRCDTQNPRVLRNSVRTRHRSVAVTGLARILLSLSDIHERRKAVMCPTKITGLEPVLFF